MAADPDADEVKKIVNKDVNDNSVAVDPDADDDNKDSTNVIEAIVDYWEKNRKDIENSLNETSQTNLKIEDNTGHLYQLWQFIHAGGDWDLLNETQLNQIGAIDKLVVNAFKASVEILSKCGAPTDCQESQYLSWEFVHTAQHQARPSMGIIKNIYRDRYIPGRRTFQQYRHRHTRPLRDDDDNGGLIESNYDYKSKVVSRDDDDNTDRNNVNFLDMDDDDDDDKEDNEDGDNDDNDDMTIVN